MIEIECGKCNTKIPYEEKELEMYRGENGLRFDLRIKCSKCGTFAPKAIDKTLFYMLQLMFETDFSFDGWKINMLSDK